VLDSRNRFYGKQEPISLLMRRSKLLDSGNSIHEGAGIHHLANGKKAVATVDVAEAVRGAA
jgi:hypothetical protein